jgi:two-component system phosphate regulon sensor histidine kinase PhoR
VAVYEIGLTYQLTALPVAAALGGVLEDVAVVLAIVLVAHLLLDLAFLRRRRRSHELALREHQLAAVAELSAALALAGDRETIARTVLDTLNELVGFDFSGLVLIAADGSEARGLMARAGGADVSWYPSLVVDLESTVSGVRRAFETHAIFTIGDAPGSSEVNAELIERTGLKSVVFLPLEGDRGVVGVLMAGATREFRSFRPEQLSLLRMLAAEGALALQRIDSLNALERGLERERLVAEISRRVRAELDIDRLIDAALAETAKALDVTRCFIRLGDPDSAAPLRAEWRREGIDPIPPSATPYLAVSNLALRERKTAAVADVENDPRLADDSLLGRKALIELGSRAVLSAPIVLFDSVIGALAAHTSEVRRWSDDDIAFIEAIARELGIALHTAGLIDENKRRLEEQKALLVATEAMANELELDSVLAQRLAGGRAELVGPSSSREVMVAAVRQAISLLDADAALMLELEANELVVREGEGEGLEELYGRRLPLAVSLAGDLVRSRKPLVVGDLARDEGPLGSLDPIAGHDFKALIGVPLIGPDDALSGVLVVYSRRARAWRPKEIEALVTLAANTATALASAVLYLRVSLEREQSIAILSSVADGIVAVDRAGQIVLWNAAAERITGIRSSEALGRLASEVLRYEIEAPEGSMERSIPIKRGERELWLQVTEAVMRDPAGQIAGKIYTLRDVSAERFVEQAKSDFVSSISHELRAPLTSIFGFAETLLRRGELFDDLQRRTFLAYISSESERLTGIVDALLDVAELDSGDLQVELTTLDVGNVVREVVESARADLSGAREDGHTFVIDFADEPLGAQADREKLRLVLVNLIDNAIKFSPKGGTVNVAGQRRSGTIELRVTDEGVGIPEEERERIFRKFYRGSSSVLSGGAGLGLFITRGLVTAMGGRIWVDSTEGEGSTFVLELPSRGETEAGE